MKKGAGAASLYETLKGLAAAGYYVTFLTTQKKLVDNNFHSSNQSIEIKNVKTIRVNLPNYKMLPFKNKFKRFHGYFFTFIKKVRELCENETFDLVYAYEELAILPVASLKRKGIITCATVNRYQGTILGARYKSVSYCLRKILTWLAIKAKADMYIMTDDGTMGDKALFYWNKEVSTQNLLFIRNGIDFSIRDEVCSWKRAQVYKELMLEPNCTHLLTVSRLASWKRVDRALLALQKLKRKSDKLKLIVCGSGPEEENLRNLAKELEVESSVYFVGAQTQINVAKYMYVADIFLSLYDVSNCGNPLFEAQLLGKPVVTIDNGSTAEVITDYCNGLLVSEPVTIEDIAGKVSSILNNKNLKKELSSNAKKWSEYNLESWSSRMIREVAFISEHCE